MPIKKSQAQIKREINEVLARKPGGVLPEGAPTHCDYCSKPPVVWIRSEADIPPGFQDPVHWLAACADHEHSRNFQEWLATLSRQKRGTVDVFRRA